MKFGQRMLRRHAAIGLVVGLAVWSIACGGGGQQQPVPATGTPPVQPAFALSISQLPVSENHLTARLMVADAAELYQLSCRVSYDPAVLRPVASRRAGLITADATFFTTLKADRYIPVAFTYHEGAPLPAAAGVLAEIEFEVIDPLATPQLSLITDADYLIARDNTGADLLIGLEVAQ